MVRLCRRLRGFTIEEPILPEPIPSLYKDEYSVHIIHQAPVGASRFRRNTIFTTETRGGFSTVVDYSLSSLRLLSANLDG